MIFWKSGILHHGYYYGYTGLEEEQVIPTENGALHNVVYFIISSILGKESFVGNIMDLYRDDRWHPCIDDSFSSEGFSHDNMTAIVSLGLFTDDKWLSSQGMKFIFKNRYFHPRDIFFYLWASTRIGLIPFLAFTAYQALFGSFKGKQLAWLRLVSSSERSVVCVWVFRLISGKINWFTDMAEKYYFFGDHPTRELFREYQNDPSNF